MEVNIPVESPIAVIETGKVPTPSTLKEGELGYGKINGIPKIYGNVDDEILDFITVIPSIVAGSEVHWYCDSVNGNDSNDGKSSTTAMQTLTALIVKISNTMVVKTTGIAVMPTIHLAAGTYSSSLSDYGFNSKIFAIEGNTANPGSVILNTSMVRGFTYATIKGVTMAYNGTTSFQGNYYIRVEDSIIYSSSSTGSITVRACDDIGFTRCRVKSNVWVYASGFTASNWICDASGSNTYQMGKIISEQGAMVSITGAYTIVKAALQSVSNFQLFTCQKDGTLYLAVTAANVFVEGGVVGDFTGTILRQYGGKVVSDVSLKTLFPNAQLFIDGHSRVGLKPNGDNEAGFDMVVPAIHEHEISDIIGLNEELGLVPKIINPVAGVDWYCDAINGDDANDGRTALTAVKTIKGIFIRIANATVAFGNDTTSVNNNIHLAPGSYTASSITDYNINKRIATISGDTAHPENVILTCPTIRGFSYIIIEGVTLTYSSAVTFFQNEYLILRDSILYSSGDMNLSMYGNSWASFQRVRLRSAIWIFNSRLTLTDCIYGKSGTAVNSYRFGKLVADAYSNVIVSGTYTLENDIANNWTLIPQLFTIQNGGMLLFKVTAGNVLLEGGGSVNYTKTVLALYNGAAESTVIPFKTHFPSGGFINKHDEVSNDSEFNTTAIRVKPVRGADFSSITEVLTGEFYKGEPVYAKVIELANMTPGQYINDLAIDLALQSFSTARVWIDHSYSFYEYMDGMMTVLPLGLADKADMYTDGISARIYGSGSHLHLRNHSANYTYENIKIRVKYTKK